MTWAFAKNYTHHIHQQYTDGSAIIILPDGYDDCNDYVYDDHYDYYDCCDYHDYCDYFDYDDYYKSHFPDGLLHRIFYNFDFKENNLRTMFDLRTLSGAPAISDNALEQYNLLTNNEFRLIDGLLEVTPASAE